LKYREFKETYGIGHNECMTVLSGATAGGHPEKFYDGTFKIKDYKEACKTVEKIMLIEPYYIGFRRRSFIYAMLQLFKNENFEFTEFLQKLKLQPTALVDCATTNQYVALIEEVYNYRRRDKVNLRY
jgi:hypothetical protein